MARLSLTLALVSLILGVILIAFVLSQRGVSLTLGMIVGAALTINGALRLWLATRAPGLPPSKVSRGRDRA